MNHRTPMPREADQLGRRPRASARAPAAFLCLLLTASGVIATVQSAAAQSTTTPSATAEIPFSSDWDLGGDARIVDRDGHGFLEASTGVAAVPGVELKDGTIEVEVQVTSHRAFAYVRFRDGGDGHREEIYLRTHKSRLPDALQYTPVIGGVSQWQIFHGEKGTAAVELPSGQWIPLRLEIAGRRMAVFVGDGPEPAMVIERLAHEPRGGRISLRSFVTAESAAPFGARFRRLRISPGRTSFDFDSLPPGAAADPLIITGWQTSPAFAIDKKIYSELPEVDESAWRDIASEPDGTVLLDRLPRPPQTRAYGAVLRLRIEAAEAATRSLDLGFSDAVSVFLNGRPIVGLDQSYRFDRPRVQGVMGLHQCRLHLPLEEGPNELRLVVTESFGGWGLIGRWVDAEGIRVVR